MDYLLGIDLGTTGVKVLLINNKGKVVDSTTKEYPLITPHSGWAEQNSQDWRNQSFIALKEIVERNKNKKIGAIGLTGQMHGAVLLDSKGEVIRAPILWCDQRTAEESKEIHRIFGYKRFLDITGNPALTGFTAPKILWVKKNEPENFKKISKILLPKDYLRFLLTEEFFSDVSDASGTSLFNVERRNWSREIIKGLELKKEWLPEVKESVEIAGKISKKVSSITGIKYGTPVVAGAGDQAASAFGCGIIREGIVSLTLGTSGVLFASTDKMEREEKGRLHSFCHAVRNKWHLMGVMLSAGGSFRWFRDALGKEEKEFAKKEGVDPYEILTGEAEKILPGSEGVIFLPYLAGERTPHQDPYAKGVFFGISLKTTKSHLIRSVLEGISFGLKDSLELMKKMGLKIEEVRIVGGGARSFLWRKIISSIFELPLYTLKVEEGSSYGAALLAGVGIKIFSDEEDASKVIEIKDKTIPESESVETYHKIYPLFKEIYQSLKSNFQEINKIIQP